MSTPQDEAAGAAKGTEAPHDPGERHMQQPTEEELRAAYEAELSRITTGDMILQSAASLLNIGGLRLGLVSDAKVERDLEQVRDAIDAVRGLLPIIERHGRVGPQNLRPLRDALSQLQMAYTREIQASTSGGTAPGEGQSSGDAAGDSGAAGGGGAAGGDEGGGKRSESPASPRSKDSTGSGPGPAESSGRLWVPGR